MELVVKPLYKLNLIIQLPTKNFICANLFFMFDPHYTRYSNRRKYQKKGQIIQARRVEIPRTIEQSLVPLYKEYFTKNYIQTYVPPQDHLMPPFYFEGPSYKFKNFNGRYTIQPNQTLLYIITSDNYYNINFVINISQNPNSFVLTGAMIENLPRTISLINQDGEIIFNLSANKIDDTEGFYPILQLPERLDVILNDFEPET